MLTTYTVKKGDSLSSIGNKFGVNWQSIWAMNKTRVKNPNVIRPGQKLKILVQESNKLSVTPHSKDWRKYGGVPAANSPKSVTIKKKIVTEKPKSVMNKKNLLYAALAIGTLFLIGGKS
jgi:LysM repeat protein